MLNQLSLSAWLPSAALVLGSLFVIQIGGVLDKAGDDAKEGGWASLTKAFTNIAGISVGGALLLFACVVVLTTMTQAFSFEAIRFLEGYWGATQLAESIADRRVKRFADRVETLDTRYNDLTRRAWEQARSTIDDEKGKASKAGETDSDVLKWTHDQLAYLGAKLRNADTDVVLDKAQRLAALKIPWEQFAPPALLRRRVSIDKRRRDYPTARRCLPTRLGNVLRAHEDQTGRNNVETLVLEIYDELPLAARTRHDEHRNRLDLYASLLFVDLFVVVLALGRFLPTKHWWHAGGAVIVGILLMIVFYRAAIASARVYGILLVDIARRPTLATPSPPLPAAGGPQGESPAQGPVDDLSQPDAEPRTEPPASPDRTHAETDE